jgi:hypothetical protein
MDDQLIQALLQRVSASGPGASLDVTDLLAETAQADPRLSMLAQLLARRQPVGEEESAPSAEIVDEEFLELEPESAPSLDRSQEKAQALRQLRRRVEDLYQELEELRERNDALAAGLGACYLCWGDDPNCLICAGQGVPGYFQPDSVRFEQLVIPAVQRIVPSKRAGRDSNRPAHPHRSSNPN